MYMYMQMHERSGSPWDLLIQAISFLVQLLSSLEAVLRYLSHAISVRIIWRSGHVNMCSTTRNNGGWAFCGHADSITSQANAIKTTIGSILRSLVIILTLASLECVCICVYANVSEGQRGGGEGGASCQVMMSYVLTRGGRGIRARRIIVFEKIRVGVLAAQMFVSIVEWLIAITVEDP